MKKVTKKVLVGVLLILVMVALAACQQTQKDDSDATDEPAVEEPVEKTENVISDVESSDAETHVVIGEQSFTEGEKVENPYYKRVTNPDGVPCFEVVKAADGSIAYLPMSDTVVYTSDAGECFYETVTLNYNLDGKPVTATQYQLYVTSGGVVDVPADGAETAQGGSGDVAESSQQSDASELEIEANITEESSPKK